MYKGRGRRNNILELFAQHFEVPLLQFDIVVGQFLLELLDIDKTFILRVELLEPLKQVHLGIHLQEVPDGLQELLHHADVVPFVGQEAIFVDYVFDINPRVLFGLRILLVLQLLDLQPQLKVFSLHLILLALSEQLVWVGWLNLGGGGRFAVQEVKDVFIGGFLFGHFFELLVLLGQLLLKLSDFLVLFDRDGPELDLLDLDRLHLRFGFLELLIDQVDLLLSLLKDGLHLRVVQVLVQQLVVH